MLPKLIENVLVTLALVAIWIAVSAALQCSPRVIASGLQLLMFGGYGWPRAFSCVRRIRAGVRVAE